jgi:hypothetical protein
MLKEHLLLYPVLTVLHSNITIHCGNKSLTWRVHIGTQPGDKFGPAAHYTYTASHPPIKLLYNINLRAPPSAPAGNATHKQPC